MHLFSAYCHNLRKIKLLSHCDIPFGVGKEKLKNLVTSSEPYLVFKKITQYKGQKKLYLEILLLAACRLTGLHIT